MISVHGKRVSVMDKRQLKMSGQAVQTDPVPWSKVQNSANTQDQRKSSPTVSRNSHILAGQGLHRDQIWVLQFTAEVMFETFGCKLGRTKAVSVARWWWGGEESIRSLPRRYEIYACVSIRQKLLGFIPRTPTGVYDLVLVTHACHASVSLSQNGDKSTSKWLSRSCFCNFFMLGKGCLYLSSSSSSSQSLLRHFRVTAEAKPTFPQVHTPSASQRRTSPTKGQSRSSVTCAEVVLTPCNRQCMDILVRCIPGGYWPIISSAMFTGHRLLMQGSACPHQQERMLRWHWKSKRILTLNHGVTDKNLYLASLVLAPCAHFEWIGLAVWVHMWFISQCFYTDLQIWLIWHGTTAS